MVVEKTPNTLKRSSNEEQVYGVLLKATGSMSAYEILTKLQNTNVKAAVQVYRALDRLITQNRVHRIESLNAFIACRCESHSSPAGFYICDTCGSACEFDSSPALGALHSVDNGFKVQKASIELRGLCNRCASTEARSQ